MRVPGFILRELLDQAKLTPVEKALCLMTAEYHPRSILELARKAGISRKLATKACRNLAELGWIALVESRGKIRPVALIPRPCQEKMVQVLETGYDFAGNKGEFLMKCCLDLWVHNDEFVDNARPSFLINPATGERLEYDRYYLQGVAFEFNGAQHYEVTEVYSDERALGEAKARDFAKETLSMRNNVTLVTVTSEDLVPGAFEKVIPHSLLLNTVSAEGHYFEVLTRICRGYRAKAERPTRNIQPTKPRTGK